MSKKELLLSEIEQVPKPLVEEILGFVRFLKAKLLRKRHEAAVASESSLGKDWLRNEEDEAWQGL